MEPTDSRREAAIAQLLTSAKWQIEYAERHRQVIRLADSYGVEVGRIAEVTEMRIDEVQRILATGL